MTQIRIFAAFRSSLLFGLVWLCCAPANALEVVRTSEDATKIVAETAAQTSQRTLPSPAPRYRADFTARVGDWFIYARKNGSDSPQCSAVREEWSQSLYLSLDDAGWSVGTDALFRVSGLREITLNGVPYVAALDDRSGLPSFTPDAEMLQALGEEGGYIGFAPGSDQRLFSLHQSGQALEMVRLCDASRGLMPDVKPEPVAALGDDCPDLAAFSPEYGDFTDVILQNKREEPVQIYVLSQYKDRSEFLGTVLREHEIKSSLGNIYVASDLSGHCLGAPRVVTEPSQVLKFE